jgi:hypothetical protein
VSSTKQPSLPFIGKYARDRYTDMHPDRERRVEALLAKTAAEREKVAILPALGWAANVGLPSLIGAGVVGGGLYGAKKMYDSYTPKKKENTGMDPRAADFLKKNPRKVDRKGIPGASLSTDPKFDPSGGKPGGLGGVVKTVAKPMTGAAKPPTAMAGPKKPKTPTGP